MAEHQNLLSSIDKDNLCLAALETIEHNDELNNADENNLLLRIPDEIFGINVEQNNLPAGHAHVAEQNDELNNADENNLLLQNLAEIFDVEQNNPLIAHAHVALPSVLQVISIEDRIRSSYSRSPIGRIYLENRFYRFNMWPNYMVDLFLSTNIQNYSYVKRNKICLFFWGNGTTYIYLYFYILLAPAKTK